MSNRVLDFAGLMDTARSAEASIAIARAATFDCEISTNDLVDLIGLHRCRWGETHSAVAASEAMAFVRHHDVAIRPPFGARPWEAHVLVRRRRVHANPYAHVTGTGETPEQAVQNCAELRLQLIAKGECDA